MSKPDLAALNAAADDAAAALAADPENADLQAAAEAAQKALAEATAHATPPEKKEKLIELRVLLDHLGHKVDDVITLPVAEAKAAVEAGWADDHKDAVAFAKAQAKGH